VRATVLSLIKGHGVPIGAGVAGILVVLYLVLFSISTQQPPFAAVIKVILEVIFKSLTMMGSLFAFFLVCFLEEANWGEAKDYRTYVAIGALAGFAISLLLLLDSFGVITLK
jgi:predicted membrane protein